MTDDLMRAVGRIEGKLDGIADTQKDQSARLQVVEAKVSNMLGWASGLGAAFGMAGAYLKSKLGGGQ